jgi:hypothetical protein
MNKLIILIVTILALATQVSANLVRAHEQSTVVSAMLYEPYLAALASLVLLIATLI